MGVLCTPCKENWSRCERKVDAFTSWKGWNNTSKATQKWWTAGEVYCFGYVTHPRGLFLWRPAVVYSSDKYSFANIIILSCLKVGQRQASTKIWKKNLTLPPIFLSFLSHEEIYPSSELISSTTFTGSWKGNKSVTRTRRGFFCGQELFCGEYFASFYRLLDGFLSLLLSSQALALTLKENFLLVVLVNDTPFAYYATYMACPFNFY